MTPDSPRIASLARLAAGPRWRFEAMRAHGAPVLYWITRGQGRLTLAGATQGYGPHNAIFLPAGTMHGFDLGAQTQGSILFFAPGTEGLPPAPLHLRLQDVARQGELTQMIDRIAREAETPDRPGTARALACLAGLVAVWLERQPPAETRPASAARRMAARYTAVIERGFHTGGAVADYARDLGVTAAYLTRVCRESCGRSAHDLLQDRRFYEARRLLRDTDRPVGEVARAAGFTSAAYFTRAFAQATGQTPTAFRSSPQRGN